MYVHGCFSATMAELSICHRDSIAPKSLKYLLSGPSQKKFVPDLIQFPHLQTRKPSTNTLNNWHNNRANHFSRQNKILIFWFDWKSQSILILCILVIVNVNIFKIVSQDWKQSEGSSLFKLNFQNTYEIFCSPCNWRIVIKEKKQGGVRAPCAWCTFISTHWEVNTTV